MSSTVFSFRNRLLLLVAISIVPAVLLSIYVTSEQRRIAKENVEREAMNAVRLVSAHQERLLESGKQLLLFITHLPAVRSEDGKACDGMLAALMPRYPLYANIGAARANGDLFCSGLPLPKTISVADRPWFKGAMRRRDFVVGEYQAGRVTGETTITFASPIMDGDTPAGVAYAALNLAWIDQMAKEAELPEGTMLLVADQKGSLLVRYPGPLLEGVDALSDMGIGTPESRGIAEGRGPDGVDRLFAFSPLANTIEDARVFVAIGIPTDIAYADINRLLAAHLLGLGAIAVLSLLLAWFWGKVLIFRIQEASERLASIVEFSDDAIVSQTLDGTVLSWNKGAERVFGYGSKEMVGSSIARLIPQDRVAEERELLARIKAGESIAEVETTRRAKDGRQIYVSQALSPLRDAKGRIVGVSAIAQDITERKQLDLAQSEFVSLASHQLRTPLTAIRWSMEMLLNDTPGNVSEQKQMLSETMRYAIEMCDTIETMLIVSRIEAGKIEPTPAALDLRKFLDEIRDLQAGEATKKRIDLTLRCPAELAISTDPMYLREIVGNLVSNALRYTPEGGSVTIAGERKGKNVEMSVRDTGYGIPPHEREKIFSKFFRAGNAMKKVPNGTGLGLYLARQLTELLGGTIGFISEVGKGTTFTLIIPA
jgi:PAS domain S-box-containing protein